MKIFISYGTSDLRTVQQLADQLHPYGEIFYWDKDKIPGEEAWKTIFKWIDEADLVIVLITGSTLMRAMSVGNEVSRARTKDKTIVPLVSAEVPQTELGCLTGITYQPIDIWNPSHAIQQVTQLAYRKKSSIEEAQRGAIVIAALGFFIWLLTRR